MTVAPAAAAVPLVPAYDTGTPEVPLRVLALANNKVDNLSSISALRALVSLCEVRLQGNPVCEATGASAFRQLLIAMMPSVKSLNGGEVRERERTVKRDAT